MNGEPIRVLLVEDNPGDARLVQEMLTEAGPGRFALTYSGRLAEALEILSRESFDVIILDLLLPDSRELDTFHKINGACPDTPIVVMSGISDEELAIKAVQEGAQDYLVKGQIDSNLLERYIRYAIERKRAKEALSKREREASILAEAGRVFNTSLYAEETFRRIAELVSREVGETCTIFKLHDEHLLPITTYTNAERDQNRFNFLADNPILIQGTVTGHCVEKREPALVVDANLEQRFSSDYMKLFGVLSYICAPLVSKGEVLGVISTSIICEGRRFDENDLRLVVAIADRAAAALENSYLYEKERTQADRLLVVNDISGAVNATLDIEAIYRIIVERLQWVIPFSFYMNIALYRSQDDTFVFSYLHDPTGEVSVKVDQPYPGDSLLLSKAHKTKETLYMRDGSKEELPEKFKIRIESIRNGFLSFLNLPLIVEQECIGTLNVSAKTADAFSEADIVLLETISRHLAIAINNARTFAELQEANREMAFMNDIMGLLSKPYEINQVLQEAMEKALDFIGYSEGGIYLLDETGEELHNLVFSNIDRDYYQEIKTLSVQDSLNGYVARSGKTQYGSDFSNHPRVKIPAARDYGYKGFVIVPIRTKDAILGTISIASTRKEVVNRAEVRLLEAMGAQVGVALENSELYEQTVRAAEEWKATFNSIADMVSLHNVDYKIIRANDACENGLNMKREQLIGKTCYEVFHGEKEPRQDCPLKKAKETDKPATVEFFEPRLGVHLEVTAAPVRGEKGEVNYVHIAKDITERKLAQEELDRSFEKLRKTLGGTIKVLASTVETKDPYTAGHQRRVADLARAIATEMKLPQDQIEGVRMAGVIHDLGKLTVPTEILSKPGEISPIEYNLIKTHPLAGYEILKDIEFPWPVARMVLQHHERLNGSGYPSGLSGEDITLEARILAVADVVEAMASHRPYRAALGIDKALEEINDNRGILYDPAVVDACLECIAEKGFEFRQDDGDIVSFDGN